MKRVWFIMTYPVVITRFKRGGVESHDLELIQGFTQMIYNVWKPKLNVNSSGIIIILTAVERRYGCLVVALWKN